MSEKKFVRMDPTARKAQIEGVLLKLAKKGGIDALTRNAISEAAGVSVGLVTRYFGTMPELHTHVAKLLKKEGDAKTLEKFKAQGFKAAKK